MAERGPEPILQCERLREGKTLDPFRWLGPCWWVVVGIAIASVVGFALL